MKKFVLVGMLAGVVAVSGCAQFNGKEKAAAIQPEIDEAVASYKSCMIAYAKKYAPATDSATILAEGAGVECGYLLDKAETKMLEVAETKYMMESYQQKVVNEQLEEIKEEARVQVIDIVLKSRIGEF